MNQSDQRESPNVLPLNLSRSSIDSVRKKLGFSPSKSSISAVYVSLDNEIEFDLPGEEMQDTLDYIERVISDDDIEEIDADFSELNKITHWNMGCFTDSVVQNVKNVPVAPSSVPQCLSPQLKILTTSLDAKQDYHDQVAAKTANIARAASPMGEEKHFDEPPPTKEIPALPT